MQQYRTSIFFSKKVQTFFALALFFVIILHIIHFDHDHKKEIFGDGVQTIMHGGDKKHFFVLDVPNFDVPSAVFSVGFFVLYFSIFFIFPFRRAFDPFREALRRGKIHPKLYA